MGGTILIEDSVDIPLPQFQVFGNAQSQLTPAMAGGVLVPSIASNQPATLTLRETLTFKSDGTYSYKLNTNNARADQVIAKGVTIRERRGV